MNLQLTLALRYLSGRRLRTVLTTLAIVFGVLVLFGMNILVPALYGAFQANTLAAAGQVDATITLKTADAFDESVADTVAAVDGVRVVSGYINRTINLGADYFDQDAATPDTMTTLNIVGIVPSQASAVHNYSVEEGRFLEDGDSGAAVISETLAESLGVQVGDSLTLPSASGETALTIVGILPARGLPGNEEVLVPLAQAQAMLEMPGRINTVEANFDSVEEARRAEIEENIMSALGDTFVLGGLASGTALLTNLQVAQTIFNVLGFLALLMGGFIIFNTFRTIVAERRRDIGMLRALGAGRATIFGILVSEGLIQGVIGTALGLLFGYLLGKGFLIFFNPVLQQYINIHVKSPIITPAIVLLSVGLGVGVTLLAGLLPAMSATRVTPIEALRPSIGSVSLKRMAGIGFWSGVAMIVLAVAALLTRNTNLIGLGGILFVLGLILVSPALVTPVATLFARLLAVVFARAGTAQLAEGNLSRQPSRAAITASTTLIGIAILVMAGALISSVHIGFGNLLRKSLGSDFILVPPAVGVWASDIGAGTGLEEELGAIDGVSVVSALRFAPSEIKEHPASIMGVDPATYPEVSGLTFQSGEEGAAYAALNEGRNIIVNPVLASLAEIQMGDEIELVTPAGRQSYHVVAVAGDYLNAKLATGYISHANIATGFNREEAVLIQVNADQQADAEAVEAAITSAVSEYPQFRLISGREYIAENLAIFDAAFVVLYLLVLVLAVPSVIAMVNTLAIGVIERTREIGMLRAVGATRTQVRNIVIAEALILSALGTAFGLISGLYLGYLGVEAMRATGYPLEFYFPTTGLLIAIAAGILFGIVAAVIPARQATRLEIVQALRYE